MTNERSLAGAVERRLADMDRELQELKKEVVEARNLVIKTDNLLKNLQTDVKGVAKQHETFERRSFVSSVTAYILFTALAALGAYKFASSEMRAINEELVRMTVERDDAQASLKSALAREADAKTESKTAFELFNNLGDPAKRNDALTAVATLEPKMLSELEVLALRERAQSMRQEAADAALSTGRTAFHRREFRTAAEELRRHVTLSPGKPEEVSLLLLGQSLHALREWPEAVEALRGFLKASPGSKSADYATLILGESLNEAGDVREAIEVYRQGADRYYTSQYASWMRSRARKLEESLRASSGNGQAAAQ